MEWNDIGVDGQHTVKFIDLPYVPLASPLQSVDTNELFVDRKQGGFLRSGEWAWLAKNSVLQIVSLRNGQTISCYEFCQSRGYESCTIKTVEEIFPNNPEIMLLAVVLESYRGTGGSCSYVAVYSVELRSVLSSIELSLHLTCARFMDASACRRSLLQNFDGCLAVGSEEGAIVLLDMNIRKLTSIQNELLEDIFVPCHIVDYCLPLTEIHRNFRKCQQDGIHFGLQMEVIESPCSIQSILPIDLILGLAIGFEDGRLALYDLSELQIFYIALPNAEVTMSSIVKMDFLEPPDDPRPCLFIWAIHENGENLHAVLHSLMYEKRLMAEDETSNYFETFQASSVRLQLPLEATKSIALACQAIFTFSNHGEDDSNCLCAMSWLSVLEKKNKLLIFDLNQWYKEEMPYMIEYGKQPNYLAGYILNGECTGLHTLLNSNSIAHFNSMQRFEEHFYPNSLSFESSLLHTEGCRRYNWEGAQNRVINLLRSSNAAIFLEPNFYFNEVIRTRLMPQFIELNINSTFSRHAKYEILLSAALENNCVSLLRDCAKSWLDGSFMGNFSASTGLSLSTLTDWIWKRATCIKSRCNDLSKNLFEFGGYPLDSREQKEMAFITRQLKLLSDLLNEILIYAKKQIPARALANLENKHNSLSMASSYQEILLWLLNIGLLPEAAPYNDKTSTSNNLIPYPYKDLQQFYSNKRLFYAKINETFISKKSGSCKLLFIDSFIEHVCKGNVLHEYWLENEGNGLYPPNSLESMLRVMLVPDLSYDNKCSILLYFFLDLNMAIDEDIYKDVVSNFIKFPSVFKLSAPLIKTVQAFWNLDHDHYLPAVDEFISPFNKNQCYPQWQVELLIEVLLNQKANNLALRILESQPSLISPLLKLNTLLANELISEAFHFVRSKNDDKLLETFFTRCLRNGRFGVIRDLALSESESLILQNILKRSKSPGAESLHFVYLLQKSKYLEAVTYMDELSNKAKGLKGTSSQMDTQNLVLSAFNTTMTPVTQGLTDVYFRIKNKIKKKEVDNKSPVPLSCQLIKQNANDLLGGMYHSSALSAHFATYYWGEMEEQTKQSRHLLSANNAPFLRRPQIDTNSIEYVAKNNISYPQAYKFTEKRALLETGVLDNENDELERRKMEHKLNPTKKRRLIGQEILEDLSHFMKSNKTLNSLNGSEFTFGPEEQTNEPEPARKNSLDLLTRPLMSKPAKDPDATITSVPPEIHGILKTHSSEVGQPQRDTLAEEEKSLRFTLPSPDVSSAAEIMQNENTIDDGKYVKEESMEMETEKSSLLLTDSPKLENIIRSVSEESNKSSPNSSSVSDEEFFSPLSSQNSSKLDCSNLSKYSFLSGPQPRKPLARFSAERSEKSMTPEPDTKPPRSISKTSVSPLVYEKDYLKKTTLTCDSDFKQLSNAAYATAPESRISLDQSNKDCLKNSTDKDSSNEIYKSARESVLISKISPRRSLERFNTDQLKNNATAMDIGSSNDGYVTASRTFSKPQTFFSFDSKEENTQKTSGFSSTSSKATFIESTINEFSPQVSSSQVGTSCLNKMEETITPSAAKLSECSTVVGTLTTFESPNTDSNLVFAMPTMPLNSTKSDLNKPTDEQKLQMLDTTLSMSTYDISISESSSLQQTESSSIVSMKFEFTKSYEKQKKELFKEEAENDVNETEKESNSPDQKEEAIYDCIVLSSSSSSSSSSSPTLSEDSQEDNYEDNYSNDERENEIYLEDNIEDNDNSDFEESSSENNIYNEDLMDDYDEDCNTNDLAMDETDSSSDVANEDAIQLIEDSSSELEQEANNYNESDSDDVKVIEYEQTSPSLTAENIELPVSKEKQANEDGSGNITTFEKQDVEKSKLENECDLEIMKTTSYTTASLETNMFEKGNSSSGENPGNSLSTANKLPEIDIRIDANIHSSTTDVVTENKSGNLKQKDILDITMSSGKQKDQHDLGTDTQIATKTDSEGVTSDKNSAQPLSSKKNVESVDAAEEDAITLRVEDPNDDNPDVKMEKQLKDKSTIEKKGNTVEDKSQSIIETGSKDIKKNVDTDKENLEAIVETESAETEKNMDRTEEISQAIMETESKEIRNKKNADEAKLETFVEAQSEKSGQNMGRVKEISPEIIETESGEIGKKSDKILEQSGDIITTGSKVIEAKEDLEVKEIFMDIEIKSVEMKSVEEKCKAIIKKDSGKIAKKNELKKSKEIEVDSLVKPMKHYSEAVEILSPFQEAAPEEKLQLIVEKDEISKKSVKKAELKLNEIQKDSTPVTTQRKRRNSRSTSVQPVDTEVNVVAAVSTPRRNTRGISVPPQTISETEEFSNTTPRTRRNVRASSLQPKYKIEETETVTPQKIRKTQNSPETKETRVSSRPSSLVDVKIATRRRSFLLDSINEDDAIQDSPSTRTRLRSRLNSMDSEADSPMVGSSEHLSQQKRTRKMSVSNNSTEQLLTPKRTRRNSSTSQPDASRAVSTPRTLRGRSILSVQEEDSESIPASPEPTSSKRIYMKRKKSINEETIAESKEQTEQIHPKSDQTPESSYSASRRLTRTQLAIMEKSVALSQASTAFAMTKEESISPPSNKRITKTRSTRSSNANADTDDAESVSSKMSTASSATGTKRRITRSSIKGKDDVDDDIVSVASSFGSEKNQKTRRSKEKSSPNTTLTTIPEDAPIETKKRRRPTKH